MNKKLVCVIAVATAAVVAGIALAAGGDGGAIDCGSREFDRTAWNQADSVGDRGITARQREADVLIACGTIRNENVEHVVALLGEPEERQRETADESGWLSYQLGSERGPLKLDSEYLDIEISAGRVKSVSLSQG